MQSLTRDVAAGACHAEVCNLGSGDLFGPIQVEIANVNPFTVSQLPAGSGSVSTVHAYVDPFSDFEETDETNNYVEVYFP